MRDVAELLNAMRDAGVVADYALFGAAAQMRYTEAVPVGAWPVEFIPVFSALTREAVSAAETADFDGVPFRVVGAAHLAAIALNVGRAKDFARVLALLESGTVTRDEIGALAARHGLTGDWDRFQRRFLDDQV